MKKLGLVGGTGPESTVMYYRGLISGVGKIAGSERLPKLTIDSLSPFEVFEYCASGRLDELTEYLLRAVNNLAASGAEFAALTAATTHIVFDELVARSPIPLVSMVDETVREAQSRGLTTIGLLGTKFTMTNDFFRRPFEAAGIKVVIPTEADITVIQDKIANELEHGIVTDATGQLFINIIEQLIEDEQIEQVVLGCTELPLILNDAVSPVPCIDPVPIHIDALVQLITANKITADEITADEQAQQ